MAAAQQDLANRDLLEPILALLPTLNIIRARSVAQIWRDAVDGSPATSPIQTKQFFTPLPITEVEYDYSWTIYLITRRTGQTHRGPVGGPRNIYPVVTIQPALDIWPNRMPDRWRADFYMPLKTLITLADTRWEKRAFISQPPVKKVVLVDREATLPNLRRVMIETEDGVTFGHLAKSIVAHTVCNLAFSALNAVLLTRILDGDRKSLGRTLQKIVFSPRASESPSRAVVHRQGGSPTNVGNGASGIVLDGVVKEAFTCRQRNYNWQRRRKEA